MDIQEKNRSTLENSFDFFDSISDNSEDEYQLKGNLINLSGKEIDENRLLSKSNLELQILLKQTQNEVRSMTCKANCFVFFYKFLLFGSLILNIIIGIVAIINPSSFFIKIGPFVATFFSGIVAIFNFEKQGTVRKGISILLKNTIGKIRHTMINKNYDQKMKEIDEIKKNLAEADLSLFRVTTSEGRKF